MSLELLHRAALSIRRDACALAADSRFKLDLDHRGLPEAIFAMRIPTSNPRRAINSRQTKAPARAGRMETSTGRISGVSDLTFERGASPSFGAVDPSLCPKKLFWHG